MRRIGKLSVLLWETDNPKTCGWSICVCPSFSPSRTLQPLPWLTPHLQNKSPDGKSLPPTNSPITCTSAIIMFTRAEVKGRGLIIAHAHKLFAIANSREPCVYLPSGARVYSWLGGGSARAKQAAEGGVPHADPTSR